MYLGTFLIREDFNNRRVYLYEELKNTTLFEKCVNKKNETFARVKPRLKMAKFH